MTHPEHHHVEVHSDLDQIMHHTVLPTTRFSDALDALVKCIGNITSWLWVVIMAIIVVNVTSRYVLGYNMVAFEELQWHFYGAGFLLGLSYTLQSDHHVRVDVLHEKLSLKTQTWIELLGLVLLLLPFIVLLTWDSIPYAYHSFIDAEHSPSSGGLPYRWILKYVVVVASILLIISAVARVAKCTALLFGFPKPIKSQSN